jgi:hypothetical protein
MKLLALLFLLLPAAAHAANGLDVFEKKVTTAIKENDLALAPSLFLPEIKGDKQFRRHLPQLWQGLQRAMLRRDFEPMGRAVSGKAVQPGSWLSLGAKSSLQAQFDAAGDRGAVMLWSSEKRFQRYMLALVAVERKGTWYLQFAHAGLWQVGGMDAEGWFARADQMRRRGHAVPAVLAAQVAGSILRPAPLLRYRKEEALESVAVEVEQAAAGVLRLPLNLLKSPGYPQVIHIEPDFDSYRSTADS